VSTKQAGIKWIGQICGIIISREVRDQRQRSKDDHLSNGLAAVLAKELAFVANAGDISDVGW
jgi:hypothetical protein